jgi:hypothetical protein
MIKVRFLVPMQVFIYVIVKDLNLNFTIKISHPCGNSKKKRRNMVIFNPLSVYVLTNPSCGEGI